MNFFTHITQKETNSKIELNFTECSKNTPYFLLYILTGIYIIDKIRLKKGDVIMLTKKVMSFIIAVIMVFAAIPINAQTDFMFEPVYNCTEDMSFEMSFDNSKEFVALLKEMEIPEEFEIFADLEKFLETLFSVEGKILAQADVSEDMKKAQISIVADDFNSIDFNRNLKMDITSKLGMWFEYDFTDNINPVFEIIYSIPFMEKYVHMDIFDIMTDEEKAQFVSIMFATMEKSLDSDTKDFFMEIFEKHADIDTSLSRATIKIDNDALVGIVNDMIPYIANLAGQYLSEEEKMAMLESIDSFKIENIKLLGEKGIECKYNFKNGKISKASTAVDISIDFSEIYTSVTGMEWYFESKGNLDFTFKTDTVVSKIGSTKVNMPTITDENTFSLTEKMKEDMTYPTEIPEEENAYPHWYIGGDVNKLPLRMTLESGYEDTVSIAFEKGVITVSCEYFPDFKTMKLTNGSSKVYFDGVEKKTDSVVIQDGTTYVSNKLFTEYFGWEFSSAYYDMLSNIYNYSFWAE